jgi:hypothetical protein
VPRTFYRIVKTDPPMEDDFLSQGALRKPPPRRDARFLREWEGLSVLDNEPDARSLVRAFGYRIGPYIATLNIPDDAPLTIEGPTRPNGGHWLLYDEHGGMLTKLTVETW